MRGLVTLVSAISLLFLANSTWGAGVKPGDEITPENAALVQDLVSPGNFVLVKQGMRMKIVPTERLEWPPPYKAATEKYSTQVRLSNKGQLENFVAGLPFPLVDPNDPQAAIRAVWNYSYRPVATDDLDIRGVETVSNRDRDEIPGQPVQRVVIGHAALYNNIGRTEVQPFPTDPEANVTGIRYRYGTFPVLEPATARGRGFLRFRYLDPDMEDNLWVYFPTDRRVLRSRADTSSGAKGAATLDPDSSLGFAAKIEDFDYRLLGIKPMLAVAHAADLPAPACEFDNHRTVCPEDWEMRQLYIVEATAKPLDWHQRIGTDGLDIPKRILYIDSEGWFIAASDQYGKNGALWKTLALFTAYRDRSAPDARVAIYPFRRIFQTALVDEDIQDGFSTIAYYPGRETSNPEGWYINMAAVKQVFLDPHEMSFIGH